MKAKISNRLRALLRNKETAKKINEMFLDKQKNEFFIEYQDRIYKIHKRDINSYAKPTVTPLEPKDAIAHHS